MKREGRSEELEDLKKGMGDLNVKFETLIGELKGLRGDLNRRPRSRSNSGTRPASPSYKCFNCDQPGHFRRDCPALEKKVRFNETLNCTGQEMRSNSLPSSM